MVINGKNRVIRAFVGILVILLMASIFWYVLAHQTYRTYCVYSQQPIWGLQINTPVMYEGSPVGFVKKINMPQPNSIEIFLNIKKIIPISQRTIATIISRRIVLIDQDINLRSQNNLFLKYPVIPLQPSILENLKPQEIQLNQEIKQINDFINTVVDENTLQALQMLVSHLQQVTAILSLSSMKLNAMITYDEKKYKEIYPQVIFDQHTLSLLKIQVLPHVYNAYNNIDNLTDLIFGIVINIKKEPPIATKNPPNKRESNK